MLRFERGEVTDGTITLKGQEIQKTFPEKIVRMGITMVPENRLIFGELTVEENLVIGGFRLKVNKTAIKRNMERVYDLFPPIVRHRRRLANILSGGEQQMLANGGAFYASCSAL